MNMLKRIIFFTIIIVIASCSKDEAIPEKGANWCGTEVPGAVYQDSIKINH